MLIVLPYLVSCGIEADYLIILDGEPISSKVLGGEDE